jgi:hypothetical protein
MNRDRPTYTTVSDVISRLSPGGDDQAVDTASQSPERRKIRSAFRDLLANEDGELTLENRIYNLRKKGDFAKFAKKVRKGDEQSKGLVKSIICHDYQGAGSPCVSINEDTHLPSFKKAHVEKTCYNSYITTFFDVKAENRLTRVQIWKGHLAALNFTGAEISLWKPEPYYDDRQIETGRGDPFGLLWYPFTENQLHIEWDCIHRKSGESLLSYNKLNSPYEGKRKWWAGKWKDHAEDEVFTRFGKDYRIVFSIRISKDVWLKGEWDGKKKISFHKDDRDLISKPSFLNRILK